MRRARMRVPRRWPTIWPCASQTALDVVVARPTNCIGPWQHPGEGGAALDHARAAGPARCRCGATACRCATGCTSPTRSPACGCSPSGASAAVCTTSGRWVAALRISRSRGWWRAAAGAGRRCRLPVALRPPPARSPLRRRQLADRRAGMDAAMDGVRGAEPRRWPGTEPTRLGGRRWWTTPRRCMPTEIPGVIIDTPKVHGDDRGQFAEIYRAPSMPARVRAVQPLAVVGRGAARPSLPPAPGRPVVPGHRPGAGRAG